MRSAASWRAALRLATARAAAELSQPIFPPRLSPSPSAMQQIGFSELNAIRGLVACCIALGDGESRGGNIGCDNSRARKLFGKGDGNATGASADVNDVQSIAGERSFSAGANFSYGQAIECDFDDMLGFGAGNQHLGSDFKLHAPEFLLAGDVLRWFAVGAPQNARNESMRFEARDYFFGMRVEPGAVAAEHVQEQQLRGQCVGRHVCVAKFSDATFQCCTNIESSFHLDRAR